MKCDLADAVAGPLGRRPSAPMAAASSSSVAAAAEDRPQVGLVEREQAAAELALGGEPDPVAGRAERLGDAGDHADLAAAVAVAEALGRLDAPRAHRLEREHRVDAADDLGRRHDLVAAPGAVGVERHELDEPHRRRPARGRTRRSRRPRRR